MTLSRLKKLFPGVETPELKKELEGLEQEYEAAGHAFTLVEFGGGWQIATRPDYAPIVEKAAEGAAFHTPVQGRARGSGHHRLSSADHAAGGGRDPRRQQQRRHKHAHRTQSDHGGGPVGQTVGNPLLYGTTREFLNHLGLKGLGQLPDLPDLEAVMSDTRTN